MTYTNDEIAKVLQTWVSADMNGAETCKQLNINYFTLNRIIDRYYLQKKSSQLTETITLQSKV